MGEYCEFLVLYSSCQSHVITTGTQQYAEGTQCTTYALPASSLSRRYPFQDGLAEYYCFFIWRSLDHHNSGCRSVKQPGPAHVVNVYTSNQSGAEPDYIFTHFYWRAMLCRPGYFEYCKHGINLKAIKCIS